MPRDMTIGNFKIGPQHPPFIVAELSGNHHQSLERALRLVEKAKEAGVHAVKLQTYTPDTITLDIQGGEFLITDEDSLWKGNNLYQLYRTAYTPWEWHLPLFQRCRELDLLIFSTPFDETAVDFLETLHVPCYKIASPEIVDLPLIRKIASLGKPMILSTGASSLADIAEAVGAARSAGCQDLMLLKCTTSYPSSPKDSNLRTIPHLAETFGLPVGLSDHTLGVGVPLASIALGACLIEKHLTLDRTEGGVDDAFSLEPQEFKLLAEEAEKAWQSLGKVHYAPLYSERVTHSHRPSLYIVEDLPAGTVLQASHFKSVRPGKGLPPKESDKIIGLTLRKSVKKGTAIGWELFKE